MGTLSDNFFAYLSEQAKGRNDRNDQKSNTLFGQELKNYFESYGNSHLESLVAQCLARLIKSFEESPYYSPENGREVFLTNKETWAFLKIKRTSLYKHSKNDPHFPKPKRVGGRLVYSKKSLVDYLNKVKSYSREPP